MPGENDVASAMAGVTRTRRKTHQAMRPSNTTQLKNCSHGIARVTQSGVPRFHAHRFSPAILNLITYLVARYAFAPHRSRHSPIPIASPTIDGLLASPAIPFGNTRPSAKPRRRPPTFRYSGHFHRERFRGGFPKCGNRKGDCKCAEQCRNQVDVGELDSLKPVTQYR